MVATGLGLVWMGMMARTVCRLFGHVLYLGQEAPHGASV